MANAIYTIYLAIRSADAEKCAPIEKGTEQVCWFKGTVLKCLWWYVVHLL